MQFEKYSQNVDLILMIDPAKKIVTITLQNLMIDFNSNEFTLSLGKSGSLKGIKGALHLSL